MDNYYLNYYFILSLLPPPHYLSSSTLYPLFFFFKHSILSFFHSSSYSSHFLYFPISPFLSLLFFLFSYLLHLSSSLLLPSPTSFLPSISSLLLNLPSLVNAERTDCLTPDPTVISNRVVFDRIIATSHSVFVAWSINPEAAASPECEGIVFSSAPYIFDVRNQLNMFQFVQDVS